MAETPQADAEQIPFYKLQQLPHKHVLSGQGVKAQRLIKKYSLMAGGLGLVPLAGLTEQVALGGLLAKLLSDLCKIYGIEFSDQQNKILIASILGGAHYHWISRYFLKFSKAYFPFKRSIAGLVLRPAISGMLVYYIGRLFLVHLESGVWHATLHRSED